MLKIFNNPDVQVMLEPFDLYQIWHRDPVGRGDEFITPILMQEWASKARIFGIPSTIPTFKPLHPEVLDLSRSPPYLTRRGNCSQNSECLLGRDVLLDGS